MTQLALFAPEQLTAPGPRWQRVDGERDARGRLKKTSAVHELVGTGITVRHCGHPTALYPWFIALPNGRNVVAPNGRGFVHLEDAKKKAEQLAAEPPLPPPPLPRAGEPVTVAVPRMDRGRTATLAIGDQAFCFVLTKCGKQRWTVDGVARVRVLELAGSRVTCEVIASSSRPAGAHLELARCEVYASHIPEENDAFIARVRAYWPSRRR